MKNTPAPASTPTPLCLIETAARIPDAPAYFVRGETAWEATSWRELLGEVQAAARALIALGVRPGQNVCILGFNRPEWLIMDHAAMMVGATAAGIYWTSAPPEVAYILEHSKAAVLLVEDAAQRAKVAASGALAVVAMRGPALQGAMAWGEFLALGAAEHQTELERRLAAIRPDDIGALIYTSGTTGHPKAVMLSHGNLAWAAQALKDAFAVTESDGLISYLPMAHVAEKVGAIHSPSRTGNAIYFARSMEALLDHLKEVRPTIFFGVPRLWEKMQSALAARLAAATGVKGAMARRAMGVTRRWHERHLAGEPTGALLDLQMALARKLVLSKVHRALGMDRARLLISGAAPIAPENLRFFLGLDLLVRELYGQTEVGGPTSLSLPGSTRIGAVGKALPGLEMRIADDGELLVRSPGVFRGYAGEPDATAEALADGWLRTGDLGRIDAEGYLFITGRKKDLIITSGGKNISPSNLEAELMGTALIEHAVVVGDGRHYLVALLTLKPGAAASFENEAALHAAVQAEIDTVNSRQARVATLRKFAIIEGSFSIDDGELTATMKLRRRVVVEKHRKRVEALYGADTRTTGEESIGA